MKLLTTNFLTCAVKACKTSPASYPLHFRDAVLERTEIDFSPLFIRNVLPRVNWPALQTTASELGLSALVPDTNPFDTVVGDTTQEKEDGEGDEKMGDDDAVTTEGDGEVSKEDEETLRKLHSLLLETGVAEGKLVCGNCGFEYPIKEGVGNFLLPAHLV